MRKWLGMMIWTKRVLGASLRNEETDKESDGGFFEK